MATDLFAMDIGFLFLLISIEIGPKNWTLIPEKIRRLITICYKFSLFQVLWTQEFSVFMQMNRLNRTRKVSGGARKPAQAAGKAGIEPQL
jgi:hypothetical protein